MATDGLSDTQDQDESAQSQSRQISRQHLTPMRAPGYEMLRCLGEGSFGTVWQARAVNTGKVVAVKFYTRRRGMNWSVLSREVERLAALYTSRDIVELLDVGWEADPPYFVMEFLEHGSLADRLRDDAIPVNEAVRITESILRALIHAHGRGILHCDLKPANVLLDANDNVRISDFGQSRMTSDQTPALGTLFYMAPEQAALDATPDVRWDVYAVGALLYEMITGQPPLYTPENVERIKQAESLTDRLSVYQQIIKESDRPDEHHRFPGVDKRLVEVIDGCLEREPNRRIRNVQLVLEQLQRREQARQQRPLIFLGFLGPLLLLVSMFWIVRIVVPQAIEAATDTLVSRSLAGDVVSARILARSVDQELRIRTLELERLATSLSGIQPEATAVPEALATMLETWKADADQSLPAEGRTQDESLFLTNSLGTQIFRAPATDTIGVNFAWRDYFHNLGRELNPNDDLSEIQPRRLSGVSIPFRSQNTGQFMIAIAVPVWNASHSEVVGVLGRTLHLADLLNQWEVRHEDRALRMSHTRFLALVDTREQRAMLLDHPWLTDHLNELHDHEIREQLRFDAKDSADLVARTHDETYQDPMGRQDAAYQGDWLAAFAPVGKTGWVAVVQERRDVALQPIDRIRLVFVNAGLMSLVLIGAMFAVLWYLMRRATN